MIEKNKQWKRIKQSICPIKKNKRDGIKLQSSLEDLKKKRQQGSYEKEPDFINTHLKYLVCFMMSEIQTAQI